MPLLSPPTDNLYKFTAIAGLAILAISVFGPWREALDLERRIYENQAEVDVREVEVAGLKDETDLLGREVAAQKARLERDEKETLRQYQDRMAGEEPRLQQLGQQLRQLADRLQQQLVASARFGAKSAEVKSRISLVHYLIRVSWVGSLGGVALTFVGFLLWYYRVQQYLDRNLREESTRTLPSDRGTETERLTGPPAGSAPPVPPLND